MEHKLFIIFIVANFFQAMAFEEKLTCNIFLDKYTVYVANLLPSGNPDPLTAHCASKDWEVWNSTIAANQNISWSFCNSFIGRTLFFCHLFWGWRDASFDVFNSKLKASCFGLVCYWEVRSDGMYLSGSYPPMNFKKMHDWNNPKHNI
ncbi:hypothetical protein F511_02934 [Dorcoceras hygrometricum]|uniref:S-protein homolog n=1 Tax=Dorcoceras hygrometricum TaxID=472368 RepID=A0A2Z7AJW5_9LAMI|nr:hypothetical protein F511_02934 [Dorcoceras hygrometricum]